MEVFEAALITAISVVCDLRIKNALTDEVVTNELVSTASCQGATRRSVCLSVCLPGRERERVREREIQGVLDNIIAGVVVHPRAVLVAVQYCYSEEKTASQCSDHTAEQMCQMFHCFDPILNSRL